MTDGNGLLKLLEGKVGWAFLTKLRDSMVSKAISAITISTFILSNSPAFLSFFSDGSPKMMLVLFGGLVFLGGYVFCFIRAPSEFKSGRDIPTVIGQMLQVSTFQFFQSRVHLLEGLVDEVSQNSIADLPFGRIIYAKERLATSAAAATERNWLNYAGSVYDADLKLREFVDMKGRLICAALFSAGLLLITLPTLISVTQVFYATMQPGYGEIAIARCVTDRSPARDTEVSCTTTLGRF
ncbi:hypothetical protein KUW17_18840 [Leisingera aquaemixtae]|uniref:hypothetical protein n=1 Tax=Leisingera aquaemixtae TaxID=1396826 RepID=UPI001C94000F|nr:hypothetical protein [Leisingera aquaemixtae]MBY6068807.1 hypothetical protein [Leisingera aquaemixtae]